MSKVLRLPKRSGVKAADTWDLAPMCESDAQWEEMFAKLDKQIAGFAKFRGKLKWKLALERLIRFKPYTLSAREEEMLAMQGEMAGASSKAFRQLLDADLKFGLVKNENGEQVELSNSTFSSCCFARAERPQERRLASITSNSRPREHAGGHAERLDP
jgi:oligoendopeptidase F